MFNTRVMEHTLNPRNVGTLPGATHYGQSGVPGEGPYVQIWLTVVDGVVEAATYATYGCPASVASASVTVELVRGRTIGQVLGLDDRDLLTVLGGLPEGKEDCPVRVVEALRDALRQDQS
ncbi:MAG: iron-sulfur cluster assembly scaffold protein [Fimbriimonadaceae bacterium]|nr:iron-sulfur cluster assembly scaffold protein [Fimbriimonadaceae bacterium]